MENILPFVQSLIVFDLSISSEGRSARLQFSVYVTKKRVRQSYELAVSNIMFVKFRLFCLCPSLHPKILVMRSPFWGNLTNEFVSLIHTSTNRYSQQGRKNAAGLFKTSNILNLNGETQTSSSTYYVIRSSSKGNCAYQAALAT